MTKRPVDEAIRAFYDTLDADKVAEEPMEEPDDEESDEEKSAPGRDEFMEELARGASEMAPDIDHRISEKSAHWKIERMPIVDLNILRMAIYEMGRREIPAAIVIDEALELARQFSGEESVPFINGVLDAVHRQSPDYSLREPEGSEK